METFSALLAICAGNSPVPGEFPAQRPVTRSFDVFFDMLLNKRLNDDDAETYVLLNLLIEKTNRDIMWWQRLLTLYNI